MIEDLSIVIPAYNEGERIHETLKELKEYLSDKKADNFEVIIVNDGSTDNTLQILEEINEPNFKIFSYDKNRGKGFAIRLGVEHAVKNLILVMDADLATPLEEIEKFMSAAQEDKVSDIFIGSRSGSQNVKRTVIRRLLSWAFHTISHLIMRIGLKDTQCGFKLFRQEAAAVIFPLARMERWFLDIEILFLAKKYRLEVKEIPVAWHEVSGSHIRFAATANNMMKSLFQIKLNNLRGYYNIKEIIPAGSKTGFKKIISISLLVAVFALIYNHARISYSQVGNQLQLAKQGIQVKSIDTQIVSKHWTANSSDSIKNQITAIKDLGANYVAISAPYDRPEEIKTWTEEAHRLGLHVWFRSHWLHWEGDEGNLADMKPEEYIRNTSNFIKQNSSIFAAEDSFTMAVEPEQVGVGDGKRIPSWDVYNQFVVDQVQEANKAFASIGLDGKIHTNWISMNGWVAQNELKSSTVDKLGLITVDHYPEQDPTLPPAVIASNYSQSLDQIYEKWHKPILIGEWGYNSQREVDDYNQKMVVEDIMNTIYKKSFIVGVNYWAHMGNAARLINDTWGEDLQYRQSALVIKNFYLEK